MSHFFINVIITDEEAEKGVEETVTDKLAPYDENLEMEPHEEPCTWCDYYKNLENPRECDDCEGTGIMETTYNPDSKWDWWVIGGRWDGVMCHLERIDDGQGGFNFGDEFHTEERNVCSLEDYKNDLGNRLGYAVVTPDGKWHGKGDMGWFGMSRDLHDENDFKKYITKLTASLPLNCKVVGVDAHI